jgi:hypothetical protein
MNPRSFLALVKYHAIAALSMTRWRIVPIVYVFVLAVLQVDEYYTARNMDPFPPDANVWDVGLRYVNDVFNDVLIMLFGLILLVGDDLVRGHQNGTMRSTVLLSRSLNHWWRAKVLAMGVCSFVYTAIVFVASLLTSLAMGVRFELSTSAAAKRIAAMSEIHSWYILPAGWSTPAYALFSFWSLAVTMWMVVVFYQAASLFIFPNRRIPLFVFFGWAMLGFVIQPSGQWWDLRFLLYPGKCFAEFGRSWVSMPVFFGIVTTALLGATVLGQRRLQQMDL